MSNSKVIFDVFLVVTTDGGKKENLGAFIDRPAADATVRILKARGIQCHVDKVPMATPQDEDLKQVGEKFFTKDGQDVDTALATAPAKPAKKRKAPSVEDRLKAAHRAINAARRAARKEQRV